MTRRVVCAVLGAVMVVVLACVGAAAPAAATVPGSPGTPQAPTTLYTEDFENGTGDDPIGLADYTGAPPTSATYTADSHWLTQCNGIVVHRLASAAVNAFCANQTDRDRIQQLAAALGMFHGAPNTNGNHALTAYTDAPAFAGGLVEFQTADTIPLAGASGRYLAVSVDTAAINCTVSAPVYQFSLIATDGTTTPLGGTVNACAGGTTVQAPQTHTTPAIAVHVGTYTSPGATLLSGNAVGLQMVNNNGAANGNDAAIDNVRILDVTPQLDKSFSPATIDVGQSSTLTFTVTNTTELAAKNGWSFTDTLPAGLTITGPAATTTCPSGTVTAPGGTAVTASGNLSAGMDSCTVTVHVTAGPGTYQNGPANIASSVGLNPPGDSTLTVIEPPHWTCNANGYLFQSPNGDAAPHNVTAIDLATGATTDVGQTTSNVNAVGYNVLDNYFYGYDETTEQVARIDAGLAVTDLGTVPNSPAAGWSMGDFDDAGHLFLSQNTGSGSQPWVEIDLAPGSPTYGTVLDRGTLTVPPALAGSAADWSWISGAFYLVANNANNQAVLLRWTPGAAAVTNLGQLGFTYAGNVGATYADADGYLYAGVNGSGNIYRIDPRTVRGILIAHGPSSSANDGARCATASIPTITVQKTVDGRAQAADQFTVGLNDSAGTVLTSATTTGTGTSATTTNWPVDQGATYTITDAMAAGSPDSLSSYENSISCTDTTTGAAVPTGGNPAAWTMTVDAPDQYSCVVTNGPAPPRYAVTKTASEATAVPGDTVTYTVTVTNTGTVPYTTAAPASITDDLSAVLDDATYNNDAAASSGPDPTYAAPTLSWSGPLAVGASVTITYSVTVNDPDTGDRSLNNAVITPPGSGGDCPSGTTDPDCASSVPVRSFSVTKTAPGASTHPGDTVTYTVTLTNTGSAAYTSTVPASFTDDLSAVLDDAIYNADATASSGPDPSYTAPVLSWSGPLPVGGSVTVTYTVTVADPDTGDRSLDNTVVTPPGSGGGCPAGSADPDCATTVLVQSYSVVKAASDSTANPGDTITYTVTVTNTGAADYTASDPASFTDDLTGVLDDAVYNADADQGATYSAPTLSWSGPLAVGATVIVTYSVTVDDPDTGDQQLENTVVTPPDSGGGCPAGTSDPDCSTTAGVRSYSLAKTASEAAADPGGTVTYTITLTNTGAADYTAADPALFADDLSAVLDDATYNNDAAASSGPDPTYAAPTLSWSGPLAAGASVTVTYSVTVNDPDTGDRSLGNAAVTPPGSGGDCPSGSTDPDCSTSVPVRSFSITKTASTAAANPGDMVDYTITLTNTGAAAYTSAHPASFTDDLAGVLDDATYAGNGRASSGPAPVYTAPTLSWSGPLGVGATITITYSVTVAERDAGDHRLANVVVTPPGSGGDCPAGSTEPHCATAVALRSLVVTKTAAAATANPGDTVTYTVTLTNTGAADYTAADPATFTDNLAQVLDDATYNGDADQGATYTAPLITWSGPLAVGATVTVTYSVTVDVPDTGDHMLRNAVVAPGTNCAPVPADPDCSTDTPVRSFEVVKTTSATRVQAGDVVPYTITVTNTGRVAYTAADPAAFTDDLTAVLDDATYNDDATASSGPNPTYTARTLSWAGPLAVGAHLEITYSVTVNDPDAGDKVLSNAVVTPPDSGGNCSTTPPEALAFEAFALASDPNCSTVVPGRQLTVVKTASVDTAAPGQEVTYRITVNNTGTVAFTADAPASLTDDLSGVLDDATYHDDADQGATVAGQSLSWSGPLDVGASVTITYSVRVNRPDTGDKLLDNVVSTPPGMSNCGSAASDPQCRTSTPVASFSVTKAALLRTAHPGDVVGYRITVTNTGQVPFTAQDPASFTDDLTDVLDDAVYNDDAGAGTSYARPTLRWSGPLAVGATVTVRYSVRVDAPDTGDAMMRNVVVTPGGSGIESSGDCPAGADPAPECRAVTSITATAPPAGREPTPPLASTGSDVRLHLLLATLLICAGAAAMVFVRRRRA